jgi:hypothetical protein
MDEIRHEKEKGLSLWYLKGVRLMRRIIGGKYHTPGFGLAAQLFACTAKAVIERYGPVEGEAVLKEAIEAFGRERGRRIAGRVQALGKPASFKNWLIYTDISPDNFPVKASLREGDLVAEVGACSFISAAAEWGLADYAKIYCKYADFAILGGYSPHIKLELDSRHDSGKDQCVFRYIVKEETARKSGG